MKIGDIDLDKISGDIRKYVIKMCYSAGSGHCGGSLSVAEILAVLYFSKMKIDPLNPGWVDRDRFIASKGHCAPALYAVLALKGYFDVEELSTLRKAGSRLQGHPDMMKLPGIDISTGSLGMGLSAGLGIALAARVIGKNYRTFVLLGDGELNEGQVWEAAMSAVKFKADNITAILDWFLRNELKLAVKVYFYLAPRFTQLLKNPPTILQ